MPRFRVKAVDRSGYRVQNISFASDANAVIESLTDRGWTVLSVKPELGERWRVRKLRRESNVKGVVLFQQLAELLSVGVPLETALEETQRLAPVGVLSLAWRRVQACVNQGDSLVDALASNNGLLAARHLAALKAGQSQQNFSIALMGIAEELEWRADIRKRLRRASTYPLFAITLLILVCGFLLVSVVPALRPMLQPLESELPWITRQLVRLSATESARSVPLLGLLQVGLLGSFGLGSILVVFKTSHRLQRFALNQWLGCRFVRHWVWPFSVAAHAKTVHLLLAQSIPLSECVRLAAPAAAFFGTYSVWQQVALRVEREGLFADAVQVAPEIPDLYASLIRVGERHHTLDSTLLTVSKTFHGRVVSRMERLDVLIGPVMLILVGAMMACVIVWVLLPVYDVIALQGGIA